MALEATRNRLANLATYKGEISIEGAIQNEIVVRIPFSDNEAGTIGAEMAYNALINIEDEQCEECESRGSPQGETFEAIHADGRQCSLPGGRKDGSI